MRESRIADPLHNSTEDEMTKTETEGRRARTWVLPLTIIFFAALVGQATLVRAAEVNTGYFGNVAIMGYDPVAYFTMNDAVGGSKDHSVEWLGATWLFANEEHRQTFTASPIKYAPQYGGLCSVGVAYGEVTRDIDPEAWSIVNGKLYLNYSKAANAVLAEDAPNLIAKADANWPDVKSKLAQ
jgi:YHS domain-containing protein